MVILHFWCLWHLMCQGFPQSFVLSTHLFISTILVTVSSVLTHWSTHCVFHVILLVGGLLIYGLGRIKKGSVFREGSLSLGTETGYPKDAGLPQSKGTGGTLQLAGRGATRSGGKNLFVESSCFCFLFFCFVTTQLACQLHQKRTQLGCNNKEALKRLAQRHWTFSPLSFFLFSLGFEDPIESLDLKRMASTRLATFPFFLSSCPFLSFFLSFLGFEDPTQSLD